MVCFIGAVCRCTTAYDTDFKMKSNKIAKQQKYDEQQETEKLPWVGEGHGSVTDQTECRP